MTHRIVLLCFLAIVSIRCFAQQVTRHIVKKGETVESIASKYKVSVADIRAGNPEVSYDFHVGMVLNILTNQTGSGYSSPEPNYAQPPSSSEVQYNQNAPSVNTNRNANSSAQDNNATSLVGAGEFTVLLDPDSKTYGIRVVQANENMFGAIFSMSYEFVDHGSYGSLLGFGLSPHVTTGPLLLGFDLYPYISLLSYDKAETTSNYKTKYKTKYKVNWGAGLDFKIGVHLAKRAYLAGSYQVSAPELKTKNMFKAGIWGVGLIFKDI